MAFSVVATPDTFSLDVGGVQDVVFAFTDVPVDETGTETIAVGSQQVVTTLTFLAPSPMSVGFTVPAGVSRELVSIDDSQAVVRYSRA